MSQPTESSGLNVPNTVSQDQLSRTKGVSDFTAPKSALSETKPLKAPSSILSSADPSCTFMMATPQPSDSDASVIPTESTVKGYTWVIGEESSTTTHHLEREPGKMEVASGYSVFPIQLPNLHNHAHQEIEPIEFMPKQGNAETRPGPTNQVKPVQNSVPQCHQVQPGVEKLLLSEPVPPGIDLVAFADRIKPQLAKIDILLTPLVNEVNEFFMAYQKAVEEQKRKK